MKVSSILFDKQLRQHPLQFLLTLLYRVRTDSLLRNSLFIMGTNIVTALFGYIFWLVAAHTYSTYDVGLGSAIISVMALASTIALMGMDATLVQMLPRRESGYAWSLTLNAGLLTGLLAGLLAGVVVLIALPLFSPPFAFIENEWSYLIAIVVGVPLMTVSFLLDQAFIAERAAHNKLARQFTAAVLKIPLLVLPVVLMVRIGALGVFLPGVVAMAVILIGGMLLIPRLGRGYRLTPDGMVEEVRSMLSSLAGNQFINLGGILPYYLLPVFVATLLSPSDNAYYYMTLRLAEFFTMGSYAVSMSLFAEGSHDTEALAKKVRSSILFIGIIIGPAMVFCLFAGRYILLLFGPDYAQHGLVLFIIYVLSTVPDAITNVYLTVLRVQNRLRFAGFINVGMGALTLMLTWELLPRLGIAGAGWAFLIAQTAGSLVAGADFMFTRRHQHRNSTSAFQPDSGHTERDALNRQGDESSGEVIY